MGGGGVVVEKEKRKFLHHLQALSLALRGEPKTRRKSEFCPGERINPPRTTCIKKSVLSEARA